MDKALPAFYDLNSSDCHLKENFILTYLFHYA